MNIIGIDPGLKGAIAFYDGEEYLEVFDIPIMKSSTGKGMEVNWPLLSMEIDGRVSVFFNTDHAFIEKVGAMPGQGVSSMFKFGYVAGGLRGIISALYIPVTMVSPQRWKKDMGLSKSKDASRARACELFPKYASLFSRKKDEGRAEAALIARWGYDKLTKQDPGDYTN